MNYKYIVVGGGIAGLTAASYLSKDSDSVLLCEKTEKPGGLVGSFEHKGFTFDSGIRAIENSGVLFPMMRQLGLDVKFIKNKVSLGIGNRMFRIEDTENLQPYRDLLADTFPKDKNAIDKIIKEIYTISRHTDVLYGIDNPLFLDYRKDFKYLIKVILPWMIRYKRTIGKIEKLVEPAESFLKKITDNSSLVDMVIQHFFTDTPAFFALSYMRMYTDYYYPEGGTQSLVKLMEDKLSHEGCNIMIDCEITSVDIKRREITDSKGNKYGYGNLVWAADMKTLYRSIDIGSFHTEAESSGFNKIKQKVLDSKGNQSIFTLFLEIDMDSTYFRDRGGEHLIYTPSHKGLSSLKKMDPASCPDEKEILEWLNGYAKHTTYEISCPVLRDDNLAPAGRTGLIVSTLFEYELTEYIRKSGWYERFKDEFSSMIIDTLEKSVYKGFKSKITESFSATPHTLFRKFNNSNGAITGWSFSETPPAVTKLSDIGKAVETPFEGIYQAGHWVFSPSGFPTAIITGKLAADRALK